MFWVTGSIDLMPVFLPFLFMSFWQVAQSFLTALQNDERANYQLDIKFQESYLVTVVSLLQCNLSEGAISENNSTGSDMDGASVNGNEPYELEEGELTTSHSE